MSEWICRECVGDSYLKSLIGEGTEIIPGCSYCGKHNETVALDVLVDRIDLAIENFFEPTNHDEDSVWVREPDGDPIIDIIERCADVSVEVARDLSEHLADKWFDRDSLWHQYGEDPHFIEKKPDTAPLSNIWQKMEHSLKHEARLVNPMVVQVLGDLFSALLEDRTYDGSGVVVEIGTGQRIDHLYRARVFQTLDALEGALSHPERHLGPPPTGLGAAGRMNAKGVSVFYGATTQTIARSEVRPPVGSYVAVAKFRIAKTLRVLDLTQLGMIAVQSESIFDQRTAEEARRCDFLSVLVDRLVMPVMPELEERDYLITQAIADFLATDEKLSLDGIMFRSAQDMLGKSKNEARNVILFNKASRVRRSDERYSGDVRVALMDVDDDGSRFEPQIWSEPEGVKLRPTLRMPWEDDEPQETLDLDKNAIEIHHIRAVSYVTSEHAVEHTQLKELSSRRLRKG